MTKEEFQKYFDMFPKGNAHNAFVAAQYEHYSHKVDYELMMSKWVEYLESCQRENKPENFILSLENFLHKRQYENNYNVTLQLGFLSKYKKK